jgi:tRNA-splicing ligase RtcB (3'-phosphate/5'-hydroxy nucleic acid ligase)
MGAASWVLADQQGSMEQSFGTTCHGPGRMVSRTAAYKDVDQIVDVVDKAGISKKVARLRPVRVIKG